MALENSTMQSDPGFFLRSVLLRLNQISENRTDYEQFLDEVQRQWPAVAESLSRLLILFGRAQLQNQMLLNMAEHYEAAVALPEYAIAYRDQLTEQGAPLAPKEFAQGCLAIAAKLDPKSMYAAFLMGLSLEAQGDYAAAADWFEKSTKLDGFIAGVGYWYAARALERHGDREGAARLYGEAERTTAHWREIELLDLARFRLAERDTGAALRSFSRVAEYRWQSLIELFFDLPATAKPTVREVTFDSPDRCETAVVVRDPLGRLCNVFRWDGRFYAVPRALHRLTALDLTTQGLRRPGRLGWRRAVLGLFARAPRLYGRAAPLLRLVAKGLCRQFDRSLIRSAGTLDEVVRGEPRPVLSNRIVGFIDRRGRRFRLYQVPGLYFAVPQQLGSFSEHELLLARPPALHVIAVAALMNGFPLLEKLRRFVFPTTLREALEYTLRNRIVFAPNLAMLDVRFHQLHGAPR